MTRQTLRDRNSHILGYIDSDYNGRQVLRDRNYHILGYYDPTRDETQDRNYHVIGRGNILTSLLTDL